MSFLLGKHHIGMDTEEFSTAVIQALARGCKIIAPNKLPIICIKDDCVLEHPHADHQTYLFPVNVERPKPVLSEGQKAAILAAGISPEELADIETKQADAPDCSYPRSHALVYTDKVIAVTLYEYCYAMFDIKSGALMSGELEDIKARLSEASLLEIRRRAEKRKR